MGSFWQDRFSIKENTGSWLAIGTIALLAVPAFRRTLRQVTVRTLVGAWVAADAVREAWGKNVPSDEKSDEFNPEMSRRTETLHALPKRLLPQKEDWQSSIKKRKLPHDLAIHHPDALKMFGHAVHSVGATFKSDANRWVTEMRDE